MLYCTGPWPHSSKGQSLKHFELGSGVFRFGFCLFSSTAVIAIICLPAHLFILLPYLFYWFLLVHSNYSIVHLCLFFKYSCSLLNISCIFFQPVPSFFFQDLGSFLLSVQWIIFQADWLSPFHLVILVRFFSFINSFRFNREIKSFTEKQKLRAFSTTKPALQQMLKELL